MDILCPTGASVFFCFPQGVACLFGLGSPPWGPSGFSDLCPGPSRSGSNPYSLSGHGGHPRYLFKHGVSSGMGHIWILLGLVVVSLAFQGVG